MLRAISEHSGHATDVKDGFREASHGGSAWFKHVIVLLAGLLILPRPAHALSPMQTFGPGKVSCQPLNGSHMDCLLAASRMTGGGAVVNFDVTLLPSRQQNLMRKWCLAGMDNCIVTLTGRLELPHATRLSAITSIHWSRLSGPETPAIGLAVKPPLSTPSR